MPVPDFVAIVVLILVFAVLVSVFGRFVEWLCCRDEQFPDPD